MSHPALASLEDTLWDFVAGEDCPTFFVHGNGLLLQEAFLSALTIAHPLFGRTCFRIDQEYAEAWKPIVERFDLASKQSLVTFELAPLQEEEIRDTILLTDQALSEKTMAVPKAIIRLDESEQEEETEEEMDEDYRATVAFMSLYGKGIEGFTLPQPPYPVFPRDWHYLGPSRNMGAYGVLEDELRRGLEKDDGTLCPQESHEAILKALRGEPISGPAFYHALRSCYRSPCLLRDMASYQHDTWELRTLAYHRDPTSKTSMLVPYPFLLQTELKKMEGLSDEDAFGMDILYSDFLIPLLHLRSLLS